MKRKKKNEWKKNSLIVYATTNFKVSSESLFFFFFLLQISECYYINWLSVRPSDIMSIVIKNDIFIFIDEWYTFSYMSLRACELSSSITISFLSYSFVRTITRTPYSDTHLISFVVFYMNATTHTFTATAFLYHTFFLFSYYIIWQKNIVSQSFPSLVYSMDAGQSSC